MVQAVGVFGGTDLLGVTGAHRADAVGTLDGGFHQIDASAVLHQYPFPIVNGEHVPENGEIVLSLVFDIVNGEHRFDVPIPRSAAVDAIEIHHRQRRLPIVGVKHVGKIIQTLHHLHGRHAEERKAFSVVKLTVERGALEIVFVVDEIVGHAVLDKTVDPAILAAPGEPHVGDALLFHLFAPIGGNVAVQRHHHPHVNLTRCRQRSGQGAHHVAKPARGGEGHRLRPNEQELFL